MLRENKEKQLNFYSSLYENPRRSYFKEIDRTVDFSFINELMEKSYCKHFGRPA